MLRPEEVQHCREYLSKGNLKACIDVLFDLADRANALKKEIYMISGRLEQLERDYHEGIIDFDTYERKRNGIQRNLLDLIDNATRLNKGDFGISTRIRKSRLMSFIGGISFIIFSCVAFLFSTLRPEGDLLITDYYPIIRNENNLDYYILKIEFLKRGTETRNVNFFYKLDQSIINKYCLSQNIYPLRISSPNNIVPKNSQTTTSEFRGDCGISRLIAKVEQKGIFNLFIYFHVEGEPEKEEHYLLFKSLKITELLKDDKDRPIPLAKISSIEKISITPNLNSYIGISWIFFIILILIFIYWIKH